MIENDLKLRIEKIFEHAIINARRQLDDLVAAVEGSEEPIKANPVKIEPGNCFEPGNGWIELGDDDVLETSDEIEVVPNVWVPIVPIFAGSPAGDVGTTRRRYRRRVGPTPTTKKAAVENLHDVPDGEGRTEPTKEPNQTPQPQGRRVAEVGRLYADNFYGEEAIVKCMHAMADEIDRLVAEIVASKKGGGK